MIDGIIILEHIRTCQNHVFKATLDGDTCILRLTDLAHRSVKRLQAEIDLLTDLHLVTTLTIAPMQFLSGKFIETVTYQGMHYNAAIFPFVNGSPSNMKSFAEACYSGALLAQLHTVLAGLDKQYDLPARQHTSDSARQLIHGDFNPTNVLSTNSSSVVIDFEDACYSTYEYELANSIYMTMFDYRHHPIQFRDSEFINGFLSGYTSHKEIDRQGVRAGMDERVAMLQRWLSEPDSAPLSIASSPESWKQELANFVLSYTEGAFRAVVNSIN
jgi:Ser/Thr protein kinase RdoA (MazF antagonist)